MKIIWNPLALISYYQIVDYLTKEWNNKVVHDFRQKVNDVLSIVENNPKAFKRSIRYKNIRKAFISKHNTLFYKVKKNEIELLIFWDNRQDSRKMIY